MVIVQSESISHIEAADNNNAKTQASSYIKTTARFDRLAAISTQRQRSHEKGVRNNAARSMRNSSLDDSCLFHAHEYDVNGARCQSSSVAVGLHERHNRQKGWHLENKIGELFEIRNKLLKPDTIASSSSESNSCIGS